MKVLGIMEVRESAEQRYSPWRSTGRRQRCRRGSRKNNPGQKEISGCKDCKKWTNRHLRDQGWYARNLQEDFGCWRHYSQRTGLLLVYDAQMKAYLTGGAPYLMPTGLAEGLLPQNERQTHRLITVAEIRISIRLTLLCTALNQQWKWQKCTGSEMSWPPPQTGEILSRTRRPENRLGNWAEKQHILILSPIVN